MRSATGSRTEDIARTRPEAGGATPVYLHIGLPKTGTTFLQHVLWTNQDVLAGHGIHVPLGRDHPAAHRYAAADLCDPERFRGHQAAERLTWARLAADVQRHAGTAIVSDELLASAYGDQIVRLCETLAGAQFHVVVTVRDLARQLPSVWQQAVRFRDRRTLDEYLTWATDDAAGIWRRQDVPAILRRWRDCLPAENLHVVTVPVPGTGRGELWRRFAHVIGAGACDISAGVPEANASLDAVQAEMLRRFNAGLGDRVPAPRAYRRSVSFGLLRDLRDPAVQAGRITLPPHWAGWVTERSERMISELQDLGCGLTGSWDDLRPAAPVEAGTDPSEAAIASTAIEALRATVARSDELRQQIARLRRQIETLGGSPR